jgi:molybdenum cofactor cytidylyltransferase
MVNGSIGAVILSGGASSRMEQPKGLLILHGKSFLQHIVDTAMDAGIRDSVIVLGAGHDEIRKSLGWFGGRAVVNPRWETGQLSSIVAGIEAMEGRGHDGILLWPVDHPLITAALLGDMVRAFQDAAPPIVVPTYGGRRGHPLILSRTLFDEVRLAPRSVGLRAVVHAHNDICEVPTEEDGVLINIDTPDDYRRYVCGRADSGI